MTDSRFSDFTPQLPVEIKWSVSQQTPNSEKGPTQKLGIFIPLESLDQYIDYLKTIAQDPEKVKTTNIYNRETKNKEAKNGVWINGSGWDGEYGAYGSINPAALANKPF